MPHITCIMETEEQRDLGPSERNTEIASIKNLWENISCHKMDESSINLKFVWENKLFNAKRPKQNNCCLEILNVHLDPVIYCYSSGDFDSDFSVCPIMWKNSFFHCFLVASF